MSRTIHLLSDKTINQIAAGEVIENPASVVKELVENGIDAGATSLTVTIEGGGFLSIQISDNGSGMGEEDLYLSIQRHATSKLKQSEDLWSLATMGFRGEALASIASVSRMEILTSLGGALGGHRLIVEGGRILSCEKAARAKGTSITVTSLFYNTPARKAFQKSQTASSAEITRVLTHLALAHPRIGITLIQKKKEVFSLPSDQSSPLIVLFQERARCLLQEEFVKSAIPFTFSEPECAGIGLIGDPSLARQNRSGQYLFINNRPVHSIPLSFAFKEGYGTTLSENTHPLILMHLTLPSEKIDVNVHPQKKEVRLHDEGLIKYSIKAAIRKALYGQEEKKEVVPYTASFPFFTPSPLPSSLPSFPEIPTEREQLCLRISSAIKPLALYKHYLIVAAETLPFAFPCGLVFFDLKRCASKLLFEKRVAVEKVESQHLLVPVPVTLSLSEIEQIIPLLSLFEKKGIVVDVIGKNTLLVTALPPAFSPEKIEELFEQVLEQGIGTAELLDRIIVQTIVSSARYSLEEGERIVLELLKAKDPHRCARGRPTYFLIKEVDFEKRFTSEKENDSRSEGAFF